jgi:ABC-type uncharacterized transport system permease subunit
VVIYYVSPLLTPDFFASYAFLCLGLNDAICVSIFHLASDASQRASLPIHSQASIFSDVIYKTNLTDPINSSFLCILTLKFLIFDYSMTESERYEVPKENVRR